MKLTIPALGLQRNGGNRVLAAIANELARRGVACEFIVPGGGADAGFKLHPSISVTAITGPIRYKPLRWMAFFFASLPRLRGERILANHFVTALATLFARIGSDTRSVYLVQDMEHRFYPWPLSWLVRVLCRMTYRLPHLMPANPYLARELGTLGFETSSTLSIGAASAFIRTPVPTGERPIDVLMFLRRGRHKRLDRYQAIARDLHTRNRSVAAIAPEPSLFEVLPIPLADRLIPTDDARIVELMDRCRVLVLTSDHEGFALPPLEAMARSLPVVLFPCGGPASYARNGENALLVDDSSTEQAVALTERLLEDDALYRRLSDNARKTAVEFDLEQAAEKAADEITRLLFS